MAMRSCWSTHSCWRCMRWAAAPRPVRSSRSGVRSGCSAMPHGKTPIRHRSCGVFSAQDRRRIGSALDQLREQQRDTDEDHDDARRTRPATGSAPRGCSGRGRRGSARCSAPRRRRRARRPAARNLPTDGRPTAKSSSSTPSAPRRRISSRAPRRDGVEAAHTRAPSCGRSIVVATLGISSSPTAASSAATEQTDQTVR